MSELPGHLYQNTGISFKGLESGYQMVKKHPWCGRLNYLPMILPCLPVPWVPVSRGNAPTPVDLAMFFILPN